MSKKPDFRTGSTIKGLFSNGYIKRYIREQIDDSPSLSGLAQETIEEIIDNELRLMKGFRGLYLQILGVVIIYYASAVPISNIKNTLALALASLAASVCFAVLSGALTFKARRRMYEQIAVDRLFVALRQLERNKAYWRSSKFRWGIARSLERCARAVEGIPLALRKVSPSVRGRALRASQEKAQALRALELAVIQPEDSTQADIVEKLTSAVCKVVEGKWYELPEAPYERQISRLLQIGAVSGAILMVAGAAALIAFSSKVGAVASVLAPILIAIAIGLLNMAGLPLSIIERSTRAGASLMPSNGDDARRA